MNKKEKWVKLSKEIDITVDWAGKKLDRDIKEVVIALNFLGFRTTGSCIGHLSYGAGPYIDFSSSESSEYFDIIRPSILKSSEQKKEVDFEKLKKNNIRLFNKGQAENVKTMMRLFKIMDAFYKNHKPSCEDVRLVVDYIGEQRDPRLKNQIVDVLEFLPKEAQKKKLLQCQKEILLFGEYLKKKCVAAS